MFSGSYAPCDVTFLLKPVALASTGIAEKEKLIQSGRRHYSELITREELPSPAYLAAFYQGLEREKSRLARHLLLLARLIARSRPEEITLVSLARAGTPIGVVLRRLLQTVHDRRVSHYSISIIRDRGIDAVALDYILQRHAAGSVAFVDGWTGKGVIARELHRAVGGFNRHRGVHLGPGLHVVADLCGAAAATASIEDYLIPSCLLGATISGLVSRSILSDTVIGPGDFHGCLYYEEFVAHDLSRWFVDELTDECYRQAASVEIATLATPSAADMERCRSLSESFVSRVRDRFGVSSPHHIKPGIGESTRVLLRRYPHLLLLRDGDLPSVAHLRVLAREKRVPVEMDTALPYLAVALIREVD
jgi:hypothetical protein